MEADGFAAEGVAELITKRTGPLITPMTEIANSSGLLNYPGTITVSFNLYLMWMDELVQNLVSYSFKNLLFITGHDSSVSIITYVAMKYQREQGIQFAQVDWRRF